MRGHVSLSGDIRTSFHLLCAALQRDFPFDFLFLSDWMECSFDSCIDFKLSYPVIASSSRVRSLVERF